jgi:hypothetical protein
LNFDIGYVKTHTNLKWAQLYAEYCLHGILLPAQYEDIMNIISIVRDLSQRYYSREHLQKLVTTVRFRLLKFEQKYPAFCKPLQHALLHLPKQYQQYGAPVSHWCFGMER